MRLFTAKNSLETAKQSIQNNNPIKIVGYTRKMNDSCCEEIKVDKTKTSILKRKNKKLKEFLKANGMVVNRKGEILEAGHIVKGITFYEIEAQGIPILLSSDKVSTNVSCRFFEVKTGGNKGHYLAIGNEMSWDQQLRIMNGEFQRGAIQDSQVGFYKRHKCHGKATIWLLNSEGVREVTDEFKNIIKERLEKEGCVFE